MTEEEKAKEAKKKLGHIPRFLKRLNTTLFAKATAEQIFLVDLDIMQRKMEKVRKRPKPSPLKTRSDRCIPLTPPIEPVSKKNILGSKHQASRRQNPMAVPVEKTFETSEKLAFAAMNTAAIPLENKLEVEAKGHKKTESKIIGFNARSKKTSTIPLKEGDIEEMLSVYSE